MSRISQYFNDAAAKVVTHMPRFLGGQLLGDTTLGSVRLGHWVGEWYRHNGHFKFAPGDELEIVSPRIDGFGLNPYGWSVVGYEGGEYLIDTHDEDNGIVRQAKWDIEFLFKKSVVYEDPPGYDSFRPRWN